MKRITQYRLAKAVQYDINTVHFPFSDYVYVITMYYVKCYDQRDTLASDYYRDLYDTRFVTYGLYELALRADAMEKLRRECFPKRPGLFGWLWRWL